MDHMYLLKIVHRIFGGLKLKYVTDDMLQKSMRISNLKDGCQLSSVMELHSHMGPYEVLHEV